MADLDPVLLPRPRRVEFASQRVRRGEIAEAREKSLRTEGYRLTIDGHGAVRIDAADDAGAFYARATLEQLEALYGDEIPVGVVEDWPDLSVRGVMLDVSRCKVPTLETLFDLVRRLASWKLNHLELYMEHTFAYADHDDVWRGADPFDAAQLGELRRHCEAHHMSLEANQNCLGHMERWLVHDRYAPLGISRGVVSGPMGMPLAASTLDPSNPGSAALVGDLTAQLGQALPGDLFHVGLDEPWELPAERAGEWRTWLEHLHAERGLAGRRLLVWGDMLATHSHLLDEWPDRVTVCEWGYEANHPFTSRTSALAGRGIDHWVSPGTSSWMSIIGRTTNAVENCRAAAHAAGVSGASGMLVTDWGDWGHLQHLPVSDPGLAAAAAFSWSLESNAGLDAGSIARALDLHCYSDAAGEMGQAVFGLGDAHLRQPCQLPNISTLALPLYLPQLSIDTSLDPSMTAAHFDDAAGAIDDAVDSLKRARPSNGHGVSAVEELCASGALVRLACRDARQRLSGDGTLAGLSARQRADLADDMDDHLDAHRSLWLARNRPGGLDESCAWLEHYARCQRAGVADERWAGPFVDRVRRKHGGR